MSREADLYKDKIEVSLDGRQIFYLFFGGAVIVGLVFVLGVMVGRRVEARGHVDRARTTAAVDPLAALDRLEDKGGGLSFKGSLMGTPASSDVEQQIVAIEKARAKADKPKQDEAKKSDEPKQSDAAKQADAAKPNKDEPKQVDEQKKPDEPKQKDEPKKDVVAEVKKAEPKQADEPKQVDEAKKLEDKKKTDEAKKKSEVADAAVVKPSESKPDKKPEEAKSKYTLQLSSFQERAEADAFLSSLEAQGYQAHVTEASVTGKTFYRVRMGSYKSIEAANDAKSEFEKASKKTASVMRL